MTHRRATSHKELATPITMIGVATRQLTRSLTKTIVAATASGQSPPQFARLVMRSIAGCARADADAITARKRVDAP